MMEDYNEVEAVSKKSKVPENETKEERFQRLAVPRVNKIIAGLGALGKLGNRSSYGYTDEQVEKMFSAIRNALDESESHFKTKEKSGSAGFSF